MPKTVPSEDEIVHIHIVVFAKICEAKQKIQTCTKIQVGNIHRLDLLLFSIND